MPTETQFFQITRQALHQFAGPAFSSKTAQQMDTACFLLACWLRSNGWTIQWLDQNAEKPASRINRQQRSVWAQPFPAHRRLYGLLHAFCVIQCDFDALPRDVNGIHYAEIRQVVPRIAAAILSEQAGLCVPTIKIITRYAIEDELASLFAAGFKKPQVSTQEAPLIKNCVCSAVTTGLCVLKTPLPKDLIGAVSTALAAWNDLIYVQKRSQPVVLEEMQQDYSHLKAQIEKAGIKIRFGNLARGIDGMFTTPPDTISLADDDPSKTAPLVHELVHCLQHRQAALKQQDDFYPAPCSQQQIISEAQAILYSFAWIRCTLPWTTEGDLAISYLWDLLDSHRNSCLAPLDFSTFVAQILKPAPIFYQEIQKIVINDNSES